MEEARRKQGITLLLRRRSIEESTVADSRNILTEDYSRFDEY